MAARRTDPPKGEVPSPPTEHRALAPGKIRCAVVTVSDTRGVSTDRSGALIRELLFAAGHETKFHEIVPDDPERIGELVRAYAGGGGVDAVLLNGGTGISPRDQTIETLRALLDRELPGFGELFRMLSWEEIGAAAMLSRAVAGHIGRVAVFSMPGSSGAVRLAMEKLILPELGHVIQQLRK